jgi:hypothetical protein
MIYVKRPKKTFEGNFYSNPRVTVWIKSTRIRWFSGQSDRRLDLDRGGQRCSKNQPSSRRAMGSSPHRSDDSRDGRAGGWTLGEVAKDTQGDLENISRQQRDLIRKLAY